MSVLIQSRARVVAMLALLFMLLGSGGIALAGQAPIVRATPPPTQSFPSARPSSSVRPVQSTQSAPAAKADHQHLAEWMDQHRNLNPQQQQQALTSEPGFRQLPPETQQRMLGRLAQLNSMAPQQRTRVLERAEEIEHLAPAQRQEVRGAMAELGRFPPDRRKIVGRAFRDLRAMPPSQRQAYLSSEYLHRTLSPQERLTLDKLMKVEPLLPPPNQNLAPQPPQ